MAVPQSFVISDWQFGPAKANTRQMQSKTSARIEKRELVAGLRIGVMTRMSEEWMSIKAKQHHTRGDKNMLFQLFFGFPKSILSISPII